MKIIHISNIKLILILFILSITLGVSNSYSQGFTNVVISLTGKVISSNEKYDPKVKVTILDNQDHKVASTSTNESSGGFGYFLTGLKPNTDYKIILEGKGFFTQEIPYKTPNTDKYLELSKDFVIQPMEIGNPILVKVVPFDKSKSKLRNGSDYIFEDYLSILKKNPRARFEIQTYADNNLDKNFNKILTEERAKALKDYFVSAGIPEMRLQMKGLEFTDPKNPPPFEKAAKGKKYVGSVYLVVTAN